MHFSSPFTVFLIYHKHAVSWAAVQHMLSNRRYIGEYSFRDIVIPDGIPAIVPLDLFERVQEKLEKNKKAPARAKAEENYLLTTKIFCGHCGTSMNGESGKSRNGTIHRYYKCHAVKKKLNDCKKKPVKKEWIEDLVVKETMTMLMDDDAIEAIVSMLMRLQDEEGSDLPMYEQQLRETETAIENAVNAILGGMVSKALQTKLTQLESTKEELLVRIEEEKLEKPKISAEFMTFWLHRFRKLDVTKEAHRQMLVDTFVNAVFVHDDKLLLTFNFKDGTRTITLTDAKIAEKKNSGSNLDCSGAPKEDTPDGVSSFGIARQRLNPSKCVADERRRRGLDRAAPLFSPSVKMKIDPGHRYQESGIASLFSIYKGNPSKRRCKTQLPSSSFTRQFTITSHNRDGPFNFSSDLVI